MNLVVWTVLLAIGGLAHSDKLPAGWPSDEYSEFDLLMDFDEYSKCNHAYREEHSVSPADTTQAIVDSGHWAAYMNRVAILLKPTRYADMLPAMENQTPFDQVLFGTQLVIQASVSDQVDDRQRIQFLALVHHALSHSTHEKCQMPDSVKNLIESIGSQ